MTTKTGLINRAPVLTLWAAVVAQRLGFDEDEALTLGKAVAGLNAQAKGSRLGIFKPHEEKAKKAREKELRWQNLSISLVWGVNLYCLITSRAPWSRAIPFRLGYCGPAAL